MTILTVADHKSQGAVALGRIERERAYCIRIGDMSQAAYLQICFRDTENLISENIQALYEKEAVANYPEIPLEANYD